MKKKLVVVDQSFELKDWDTAWERRKSKKFLEFEGQMKHPIRKMIVEKTVEVGKTVLDIGCATCNDYPLFLEKGIKYYGRDITPKFVRRAKKRFPDVDVKEGDVLNIRFGNNEIDVVYCKDLLEHLPPKMYVDAINEMWRVARHRIMIGFFIAPGVEETKYRVLKNMHWNSKYGKDEILVAIAHLKEVKNVEIIENIGPNNSALYVVDRNEIRGLVKRY